MFVTPGAILAQDICDWMLNKNYESHVPDLKTIGNRFIFPSFHHRVKVLPELNARN